MFEKKPQTTIRRSWHADLISSHSQQEDPHLNKSPFAHTSTGSHRFPQQRSTSKARKISAHKLFEKAHLAAEGETYLTHKKRDRSSEHGTNGRSSYHNKMTITKSNSLGLYKEYEIKLSGKSPEEGHSLSNLINGFGQPFKLWSGDISSINQMGIDAISETGDSQSLLDAMSTA